LERNHLVDQEEATANGLDLIDTSYKDVILYRTQDRSHYRPLVLKALELQCLHSEAWSRNKM
jgi:hypothetical protein